MTWQLLRGYSKKKAYSSTKSLKGQVQEELHVNHMGSQKTKLLTHKSIYWICMNMDIENHIKLLYMS